MKVLNFEKRLVCFCSYSRSHIIGIKTDWIDLICFGLKFDGLLIIDFYT